MTTQPPEQTGRQRLVRSTIGVLISIILTFAMIEAMLYYLDPLGYVTYLHSFAMLWETTEPSPTGYRFTSGEHQTLNYTYTILEDESRLSPNTNMDAACQIAFIGDSVTFGMGVQDDETWVNLLAAEYPDVYFMNYGRPVFSADNVLLSYQEYNADGYVWLVVDNDDFPMTRYEYNQPNYPPASRLYWLYVGFPLIFDRPSQQNVLFESGDSAIEGVSMSATVAELIADDSLIFGFDEAPANRIEEAIIIPKYTELNSLADPHPSVVGNQQIAEQIAPYLTDFVAERCG